jgi:RHS repeat-associated protein
LGSNIVLTDDDQNVLARYEYDVFGAIRAETGTSDNTRKFTGKEFDADSNLYYYAARYYDPYIGRFTQRDPAGDGVNWYAYTYNNPLKYTDPNGKEPVKDEVGTLGGLSGELTDLNSSTVELSDFMPGLPGLNSRGDPGNIPVANRYIYTEKWGWIDMKHFLSAAGAASFYIGDFLGLSNDDELRGHAFNYANALGYGVELAQFLTGNRSAFSYEDLPSNAAGAKFGAFGYDPNSDLSLGEQVVNWLKNEGAIDDSTKAPSYDLLPATYDRENPPPDPPKNFTPLPYKFPKPNQEDGG